ncbi:MAG: outer membrane beta-barrel protein [Bacteroidales bacterium]|nr:outer membrane beta-barrel protein [Bacteroidales bacterium]
MKRITLLLAILFATQIAFAQEEVAIEQNINQRINKLEINPGWNVKLIHHEADSGYRVAIITEEDLAARAYNVQLCNVKDQTLTILENTQLPQGTVVEIEGPMNVWQVGLMDRATAEADYIVASPEGKWESLFLARYSSLRVRHFHIPSPEDSPSIAVWDHAQLTIDTLSGEGSVMMNVYEGDFQYGTNILQGKITLYESENTDDWPYMHKDCRVIKAKEVDGELVTTDRRKIWNNALSVDAGIGILYGNRPTNPNSPFLQSTTLSVKVGMSTYFKLGYRWGISTGLLWNSNDKWLCHQVKYENNELVVMDGQGDFQRNKLTYNYLGIPVTMNYYIGRRGTESLSLDFYCARLLGEHLRTTTDPTKLFSQTKEKVDVFNPWKIEVGLSFNTQHLGFFHGIRVFTNLLPEYKPGVTTDKFRSVGLEIKL